MVIIKMFEKDGKWTIQLSDEVWVEGFLNEGHAGVWLLEYLQRMATVGKMDEIRRMMAGAIVLKDNDKKKPS